MSVMPEEFGVRRGVEWGTRLALRRGMALLIEVHGLLVARLRLKEDGYCDLSSDGIMPNLPPPSKVGGKQDTPGYLSPLTENP
jgi:hypothetical protein